MLHSIITRITNLNACKYGQATLQIAPSACDHPQALPLHGVNLIKKNKPCPNRELSLRQISSEYVGATLVNRPFTRGMQVHKVSHWARFHVRKHRKLAVVVGCNRAKILRILRAKFTTQLPQQHLYFFRFKWWNSSLLDLQQWKQLPIYPSYLVLKFCWIPSKQRKLCQLIGRSAKWCFVILILRNIFFTLLPLIHFLFEVESARWAVSSPKHIA